MPALFFLLLVAFSSTPQAPRALQLPADTLRLEVGSPEVNGLVLPPRVAPLLRPALSAIERWTMRRAATVNLVSPGFESYFRRRYPHHRHGHGGPRLRLSR